MEDPEIYKLLTGKTLKNYNIISHDIGTYVDDTQHIIASKTTEDLNIYIFKICTTC